MIFRRLWIGIEVFAVLSAFLAAAGPNACAQGRKAVQLSGAGQHLPFSDGIVAGNTLYIAGEQGTGADGKLEVGISAQTRAALESISRVVSRAGFSMRDLVTVNVYLSDVHDFQAMNKVYAAFLPNPKPARTTVQVAGLVNGAKIEISAVAVKQ